MHVKKNVAQWRAKLRGFFYDAMVNARRKISIELLRAACFSFRLWVKMQSMAEDNYYNEKLSARPHRADGEYWRWYREEAVSKVVVWWESWYPSGKKWTRSYIGTNLIGKEYTWRKSEWKMPKVTEALPYLMIAWWGMTTTGLLPWIFPLITFINSSPLNSNITHYIMVNPRTPSSFHPITLQQCLWVNHADGKNNCTWFDKHHKFDVIARSVITLCYQRLVCWNEIHTHMFQCLIHIFQLQSCCSRRTNPLLEFLTLLVVTLVCILPTHGILKSKKR